MQRRRDTVGYANENSKSRSKTPNQATMVNTGTYEKSQSTFTLNDLKYKSLISKGQVSNEMENRDY